jgi:hypothetical protein
MTNHQKIEILLIACVLLPVLGYLLGSWLQKHKSKVTTQYMQHTIRELQHSKATDERLYLQKVRVRIACELIDRDSERFLANLEHLKLKVGNLKMLTKDELNQQLSSICVQYPLFLNFDPEDGEEILHTIDSLELATSEELYDAYNANFMFCQIKPLIDEFWNSSDYTASEMYDFTYHHIRAINEASFINKLKLAERDYLNYSASNTDKNILENTDFIISPLGSDSPLEYMRHAVIVKQSGECGVFARDLEGDRTYYRTNNSFEENDANIRYGKLPNENKIEIDVKDFWAKGKAE